uniref:Snake toxin/toxin-like domain-containing protein n=1 Tax=Terrapene triunguis TaxID=2587831 RepID=A0A674JXE4_9SAUR
MCFPFAAHSLVCFTCKDASSNWACLGSTICPSDENYCVTTYLGASCTPMGGLYIYPSTIV